MEEKTKILTFFQKDCYPYFRSVGFLADNANVIFNIIIEMRNVCVAAEKEDTILIHKHMGLCAESIANYATINDLKLSEVLSNHTHNDMEIITSGLDLEHYLEKIKNDLSFVKDMSQSEKAEFVQKCWISLFPPEYHDFFIKISRILNATIQDNKIKNPNNNQLLN
jgi:hypothetical protein